MAIRVRLIRCKHCRPCEGHGPYLYEYWREGDRVKCRYLGRLPDSYKDWRERGLTKEDLLRIMLGKQEGLLGNSDGR